MAGTLTTALGDGLIALIDFAWPQIAPRLMRLFAEVGEALRPDPPMTMQTSDGHTVTGIVVIDRGQVIAFVGTKHFAPAYPRWESRQDESSPFFEGPQYR